MADAYAITGVAYLLIAVVGFLGSLSYTAGCPFRMALILQQMAEDASKLVGGVARVRTLYRLSAALTVAFVAICGIEHLTAASHGGHPGGAVHFLIAAGESAITAGTVLITAAIVSLFRRAAIKVRDKYRGGELAFRFWHE